MGAHSANGDDHVRAAATSYMKGHDRWNRGARLVVAVFVRHLCTSRLGARKSQDGVARGKSAIWGKCRRNVVCGESRNRITQETKSSPSALGRAHLSQDATPEHACCRARGFVIALLDPRGSGLLFFMFIRPQPYTCLGIECLCLPIRPGRAEKLDDESGVVR